MSKKVIKVKLSERSIDEAIRQLQNYKQELRFKLELFVSRLAEVGIQTIEAAMYMGEGDADKNDLRTYMVVDVNGTQATATLVLSGHDVAFIEFGAGVHYNGPGGSSPHPEGTKHGMTIGSYGQHKGLQDSWTYYDEDRARFTRTYGTQAAMPVYKSKEEIRKQIASVARQVFG